MTEPATDLERELEQLLGKPVPRAKPLPPTPGHLGDLLRVPTVGERSGPDPEAQQRVQEAHALLARLPENIRDATRGELEERISQPSLLEASRSWAWPEGNLVLIGHSEIGKTTTVGIVARRVIAQGVKNGGDDWERAKSLQWFRAAELETVRQVHPLGAGDPPKLVAACRASILILDDAGHDRDTGMVREVLAERCQRRRCRTLTTAGLTLEQLEEHYSAAVLRRLLVVDGRRPVIVDCF